MLFLDKCPEEWEKDGEFCYYFHKGWTTWQEASHNCKISGGDLTSISSQDETDFIVCRFSFNYKKNLMSAISFIHFYHNN